MNTLIYINIWYYLEKDRIDFFFMDTEFLRKKLFIHDQIFLKTKKKKRKIFSESQSKIIFCFIINFKIHRRKKL